MAPVVAQRQAGLFARMLAYNGLACINDVQGFVQQTGTAAVTYFARI